MVAGGNRALIVNAGGAAMAIERGSELVWAGLLESLTLTVKLAVPLAVGLPEITPVAAARARPKGRLPVADQV
jgi:hypothetical protein